MEEYTYFKMNKNNAAHTNNTLNIIANTIKEHKGYLNEKEGLALWNDIKIGEYDTVIIADDSIGLFSDTFCNLIPEIAKNVASQITDIEFEIYAHFTSCNCGYEACHSITFADNALKIKTISSEEGNGYCEDCMDDDNIKVKEAAVYLEDYNPDKKTYICPTCGKEIDVENLFNGCLPEYEEHEYKVIDGTLTLVNSVRK